MVHCACKARTGNHGWGRGDRLVRLSPRTGLKYRLPNGAEWEYAGTRTPFWWGREVGTGHAQCDARGNPIRQQVVPPARSGQTALDSTTHQATLRNGSRIAGTTCIAYAPKEASPPTRPQLCRARPARPEMERDQNKDVSSKTSDKIALWEFAHPD